MKLMQVWIVCCVLFFVTAELYQWIQGVTLPMPLFAIAGAMLAVASNIRLQPRLPQQPLSVPPPQPLAGVKPVETGQPHADPLPIHNPSVPPGYYPGAQLPNLDP